MEQAKKTKEPRVEEMSTEDSTRSCRNSSAVDLLPKIEQILSTTLREREVMSTMRIKPMYHESKFEIMQATHLIEKTVRQN